MKLVLAFLFSFILLGGIGNYKAEAIDAVLSWTDNSGNDPTINDQEDGFSIERKLNTGTYSVLTTVGSNIVTVTDTTLVQAFVDNNYCYRLAAFNTAGVSSYSNEACKLVPAIPLIIPASASNLTIK